MPGGEFPSLSELRKMPYVDGEAREVHCMLTGFNSAVLSMRTFMCSELDQSYRKAV